MANEINDFNKLTEHIKKQNRKTSSVSEDLDQLQTDISKIKQHSDEREYEIEKRVQLHDSTSELLINIGAELEENGSAIDQSVEELTETTHIDNILDNVDNGEDYTDLKNVTEEIIDRNYKKLQDNSEEIIKTQNKVLLSVSSTIGHGVTSIKRISGCFKDVITTITDEVTEFFKWLYDGTIDSFTTIGKWMALPFRMAYDLFEKFSTLLGGSTGSAIKYVATIPITAIKWFIDFGMNAISYVYKGIAIMFDVSLELIKKAVSVIGFGFKTYFRWMGKLILNTFTSGSLITIALGIPIIIIGFQLGVNALALLIKTGTWFGDLLKSSYNIVSNVVSWAWKSVKSFLSWVVNASGIGGVATTVSSNIFSFIRSSFEEILGEDKAKNLFNWLSETYNYLTGAGSDVINSIINSIDAVIDGVKYFFENNRFINFIEQLINSIVSGYETVPFIGGRISATTNNLFGGMFNHIRAYMTSRGIGIGEELSIENLMTGSATAGTEERAVGQATEVFAGLYMDALKKGQYDLSRWTPEGAIEDIIRRFASRQGMFASDMFFGKDINSIIQEIMEISNNAIEDGESLNAELLLENQAVDQQISFLQTIRSELENTEIDISALEEIGFARLSPSILERVRETDNVAEDFFKRSQLYTQTETLLRRALLEHIDTADTLDEEYAKALFTTFHSLVLSTNNISSTVVDMREEAVEQLIKSRFEAHDVDGNIMFTSPGYTTQLDYEGAIEVLTPEILKYISFRDVIVEKMEGLGETDVKQRQILEGLLNSARAALYGEEFVTPDNIWDFAEPDGIEIKAFANGVVIPFNENEYISLSKEGIEYVKEYTKSLPEWKEIENMIQNSRVEEVENTVVVNKRVQSIDSHELYTIRQISKGLITS